MISGDVAVAVPTPRPPAGVRACLPDLLLGQAWARPDDVAVGDGARNVTFRELVRAACGLAAHLNALGVGRDDRVGLFAESSADLSIGVWGILFAGAAYLPLAPDYPADRLRFMIEDSRTRIVVTQDRLAGRLAALAPPGTRVVTFSDVTGHDRASDSAPWRPEALAYVIYTSGSTGRPKGVMIEHHSIASQMRWMHACGHVGEHTVILQKTPMSFDAAQWEILATAYGARIIAAPPGAHRDPQAIIDAVVRHGVTTLQCVPTLLRALVDAEELSGCSSLVRIFSGGEALPRRLARDLFARLPGVSLINLYGPTECTINATAHVVDPAALGEDDGGDAEGVPIGVPVDNTYCFILDENLAPVAIGQTGELYIGGAQLARGYLHRPEQTAERFIPSPFVPPQRLYRTGDLARWNPDGTIQFAGRADNQVKLRGHRIELDEVALAVERHPWVRRAAAVVADDARTGAPRLVACVELNPNQAALMDQGHTGRHHRSKADRLQVRAQLAARGLRSPGQLYGRRTVPLPGREESPRQRREAFARKTYRFYEGPPVGRADLLELLALRPVSMGRYGGLDLARLGEILRWFGRFHSEERLLPKYAYASPGALYATQLYLETGGLPGLDPGVYYHHPADHTLVQVGPARPGIGLVAHFCGRREAIETVYRENVREVLEFEAGHMVGLFAQVLAPYGLGIRPLERLESAKRRLDVADADHYVGAFEIRDGLPPWPGDSVELYLQAHPDRVADLPAGTYRLRRGGDGAVALERISGEIVRRNDVIAINQQVYDRAAFGVTAVSRGGPAWLGYVALGAVLHRLQHDGARDGLRIGLMSSGYSSKSGRPTPAARRVEAVLAGAGVAPPEASYFFLGGRVSERQVRAEDMYEDTVHMKGPEELIKDELGRMLPGYMIPSRVVIVDRLPRTANGKIDLAAVARLDEVRSSGPGAPYTPPRTPAERWLAEAWRDALGRERVSVWDDFFACGGDSLAAVALVNRINKEFGIRLPFQVMFDSSRLHDLAARVDGEVRRRGGGGGGPATPSRLVALNAGGRGRPVFCWPGLGGYPMNLRTLARTAVPDRPCYGVQAYGLHAGETPYPTIGEMAEADLAEIRKVQPAGPYTLWGYSFGARVAFEAAWRLERAGERVAGLVLICPGNPKVGESRARRASYLDRAYVTILFSVFTGEVRGPALERCLRRTRDEDGFVAVMAELVPALGAPMIRRIARLVARTYEFEYGFRELATRRVNAPVTVIRAAGDDYSFIDARSGYSAAPPAVIDLAGDHYGVLREPGVAELDRAIRQAKEL